MALARQPRTADPRLLLARTDPGVPPPAGDPAAPDDVAYSSSLLGMGPWAAATVGAFVVAAVGYWLGYRGLGNTGYRISSDLSMFGAIFVLALAVERLLAPFSRLLGTEKAKDKRDEAAVEPAEPADAATKKTKLQALADAQAKVDKWRQAGAIIHWGVATGISFVIVGQLGVLLLATVRAEESPAPARWVDLLVTGLVIGAGTKPIHDLVAKLEKSKEAQQDPAATGGTK
jgi:hypothetical protein